VDLRDGAERCSQTAAGTQLTGEVRGLRDQLVIESLLCAVAGDDAVGLDVGTTDIGIQELGTGTVLAAIIMRPLEAVAESDIVFTQEVERLGGVHVDAVVVALGVLEVAKALAGVLATKIVGRCRTVDVEQRRAARVALSVIDQLIDTRISRRVAQVVVSP